MEGLIPMVFRAIKNSRNGRNYHHLLAQNSGGGSSRHRPLLLEAPACYEDRSGELRLEATAGQLRRRTQRAATESEYNKWKDGSFGSKAHVGGSAAAY